MLLPFEQAVDDLTRNSCRLHLSTNDTFQVSEVRPVALACMTYTQNRQQ